MLSNHRCTTASNSALLACQLATWEPAVHALVLPEVNFLQLQVWCSPYTTKAEAEAEAKS